MPVDVDDEEHKNPHSRTDVQNITKERNMNGGVGAYKEGHCVLIETKKALVDKRRREDGEMNVLKFMEDEKSRENVTTKVRTVQLEECKIALEEERLAKEKKAEERVIFMDPRTIDGMVRQY